MSRRITAGNDVPFRWAVKLQGQPFDLSGKDVKVYVINSRGEIPVARLSIEGHEVSGVFEGRYQTRLGEHSLALRVNEGRPEMKTAAVANVFELVQWSADAGGSNEGDVIVAPVLIESELSIGGGGSSYDDTEVKNELARLEREKADKSKLTELSAEVSGLSEKIENLPTAEDEILVVEYGKTTFQEVHDAYYAGKYIIFEFANNVFHINRVTASDIYFISVNGTIVYRIGLNSSNNWYQNTVQNEQSTNKVTTLSESSTDTQYPSAKAVYDAIQQSGGGGGMSTPSGDPMHYMFEAVGAEWNGTGADIERQGVYGDSYVHKAKHWHLNELGDITNEEMRVIYAERYPIASNKYIAEWFRQSKGRTTLSALELTTSIAANNIAREGAYETLKLDASGKEISVQQLGDAFYKAINCKKILNVINVSSLTAVSAPIGACTELEEFRFKGLKVNGLNTNYISKVSKASFLYLIENEAATSPITIKVSNAQYEMLTNDADIQAALTAHPNVSLAK